MSQQAQLFPDSPDEANLTVDPWSYFGRPLDSLTESSKRQYGLGRGGTLHRHSYLYSVDYPISASGDGSEVGAIELRARTWTYSSQLPDKLKSVLKAAAHRAAEMYDSTIQTAEYAGYLTGFNVINPSSRYESEGVANSAGSQAQAGKIDWNVEVYDADKNLSGVAQGIANPWTVTEETVPGRPPSHVAPHKWGISFNEARDSYDIHPPGGKKARDRYKPGGAAADKLVKINGKPVGRLDEEGRTFLAKEYAGDPKTTKGGFGTYWSREGLVQETPATYSALRRGGVLYLTGETLTEIHLRTKRALPDDYEAADPDSVSPGQTVEPGRDTTTLYVLGLRGPEEPTLVQCRRDERVIRHLGYSVPKYSHHIASGWRGP